MPDYKAMYFTLFNRITDALDALECGKWYQGMQLLKKAQQEGEELYIQDNIETFPPESPQK